MRPSPDASLALWPTRILRPWLVASAAGFSIGTFLLSFHPPDAKTSYPELAPRAAVFESRPATPLPDPFAPGPRPAPEPLVAPAVEPVASTTDAPPAAAELP